MEKKKKKKGNFTYPFELRTLLQILQNVQNLFHLGVSKFGFLSFCLFRKENPNGISILPLTSKLKLRCFDNGVVLESRVKSALQRILYTK
jgi:hypothetical protein